MQTKTRKRLMAVVALMCTGSIVHAGVVTTTTPFTGTTVTTNLTTVGNQSLPWTDSNGRTINGTNNALILGGTGLFAAGTGPVITFSNLGTSTGLGFNWSTYFAGTLTSAVFSNGDTWTGSQNAPGSLAFFGFLTDTPFTTATLTFSGTSFYMPDFTTRAFDPPGVPEPSTLVSTTLVAVGLAVSAYRRRPRRPASV